MPRTEHKATRELVLEEVDQFYVTFGPKAKIENLWKPLTILKFGRELWSGMGSPEVIVVTIDAREENG